MTGFIGEYHCKLDVKGRLLIPSDMRKQLSPEDQGQFVVSRGVDDCLSLYTSSEWLQVMNRLRKLNRFKPKDRKFARMFQKGATKVMVDGSGRILIPKDLINHARISKNIVVSSAVNILEIWDKALYEEAINDAKGDFGNLAEDVMGDKIDNDVP